MANEQKNTPATTQEDKGLIIYQVAGQEVKLSYPIVRNFLTKGTGTVTDADIVQFMSICKYNQINPFLGEAYLVKFGTQPASMIVSKEAFFKRAEENENYEGIQAGIIVMRNGEAIELEGAFSLPDDKLAGGWARVYRKDRKFPIVSKVALSEYDKKQSSWNEKPSTMISKVAKVQALREAFPTQLGAMYTQEEQNIQDVTYEDLSKKVEGEKTVHANKTVITLEVKPEPEPAPAEQKTGEAQQGKDLFDGAKGEQANGKTGPNF